MNKIVIPELIIDNEMQGRAHRISLRANFAPGMHKSIYESVAAAIHNQHFLGGMIAPTQLQVYSYRGSVGVLELHIAGSLEWWRILEDLRSRTASVDPFPPLRPAYLILERAGLALDSVMIESRVVESIDHDRAVGKLNGHWLTVKCFGDASTIRPRGKFSPSQLAVLAEAVQHFVRISNTVDFALPAARIDGDTIVLAMSTPRSLLVAAVYVWTQVCWVDLEALDFD
jgi:hypothetical protein